MPSLRPLALSAAALLTLAGCSTGTSGPSALQSGEPAPAVEAVSELVTYSDVDYGGSVEVRWASVDGVLCFEVRSGTSHGFTTTDFACGLFGAVEDVDGPPAVRIVSEWSTQFEDSDFRARWVDVAGRRCLEVASGSSHGFEEVTFDCVAPAPSPSPSES